MRSAHVRAVSSSYIATFEPAASFGDLGKAEAEGIRRGAGHVRQMTVIGNGAAWIWGIATRIQPPDRQGGQGRLD